jgi:ABC-2 type transport system ATP-binding protein
LIRQMLQNLHDDGVTIFMTTHYIEEADQLCHRVAIINQGSIVALDTPERLRSSTPDVVIDIAFGSAAPIPPEVEERCSKIVKLREERFRLFTAAPEEVIKLLKAFSESTGRSIVAMSTMKPTLEDVFIKYTGLDPLAAERMEQLRPRRGAS